MHQAEGEFQSHSHVVHLSRHLPLPVRTHQLNNAMHPQCNVNHGGMHASGMLMPTSIAMAAGEQPQAQQVQTTHEPAASATQPAASEPSVQQPAAAAAHGGPAQRTHSSEAPPSSVHPHAGEALSDVLQQQAPQQQQVPADGAEEVLETATVSAHLSVGRPAHQMAEQPQQPMQIDEEAEELQQAAASAPEMYPHEDAVDSPLSAQQSRSTVSDTGPEGSLLAAPGTESPRVVREPGSSP